MESNFAGTTMRHRNNLRFSASAHRFGLILPVLTTISGAKSKRLSTPSGQPDSVLFIELQPESGEPVPGGNALGVALDEC